MVRACTKCAYMATVNMPSFRFGFCHCVQRSATILLLSSSNLFYYHVKIISYGIGTGNWIDVFKGMDAWSEPVCRSNVLFFYLGRKNIALRNWNWFSGLLFRLKTLLFRILFFLHFLALFGPALCVYWLGSLHIRRAQIFLHFPCVCQLVSCKIIYGYDDNDNFSCSFLYADASERARVCVCVHRHRHTLLGFIIESSIIFFRSRLFIRFSFGAVVQCVRVLLSYVYFHSVLILLSCRSLCFTAHFTDDKIAYFTKARATHTHSRERTQNFILFGSVACDERLPTDDYTNENDVWCVHADFWQWCSLLRFVIKHSNFDFELFFLSAFFLHYHHDDQWIGVGSCEPRSTDKIEIMVSTVKGTGIGGEEKKKSPKNVNSMKV